MEAGFPREAAPGVSEMVAMCIGRHSAAGQREQPRGVPPKQETKQVKREARTTRDFLPASQRNREIGGRRPVSCGR